MMNANDIHKVTDIDARYRMQTLIIDTITEEFDDFSDELLPTLTEVRTAVQVKQCESLCLLGRFNDAAAGLRGLPSALSSYDTLRAAVLRLGVAIELGDDTAPQLAADVIPLISEGDQAKAMPDYAVYDRVFTSGRATVLAIQDSTKFVSAADDLFRVGRGRGAASSARALFPFVAAGVTRAAVLAGLSSATPVQTKIMSNLPKDVPEDVVALSTVYRGKEVFSATEYSGMMVRLAARHWPTLSTAHDIPALAQAAINERNIIVLSAVFSRAPLAKLAAQLESDEATVVTRIERMMTNGRFTARIDLPAGHVTFGGAARVQTDEVWTARTQAALETVQAVSQ